MSERREEVLRRIRAGEDGQTGFQNVRFHQGGVAAAELVAMANADGGLVLFGVEDSGAVVGVPVERLDQVRHWIAEVAKNACAPPIRPTIRVESVPDPAGVDRPVIVVEIPQGIFVHRTAVGRCFARIGLTKRRLTPPEVVRLGRERARGFLFDGQIVFEADVESLQRSRFESFFGPSPPLPWLDLLRRSGSTRRDCDGVDRPTVVGILIFGKDPTDFLPSAFIEAVQYGGVESSSTDMVRKDRLDGPVADQIDAAVAFVAAAQECAGDSRTSDIAPYDPEVVEEGIVNAVAHRDYSIHGSWIRLSLYADRLEIRSPGLPPNTMTLEAMPYRTFSRNQRLLSFLSRLRSQRTGKAYIASRGEGVGTILQRGEAHSGRRPEYDLPGNDLRLTMWAGTPRSGRCSP